MRKGLGGGSGAEDERPFTRLSERDSEPSLDVANDDGGSGHESLSKGGVIIDTHGASGKSGL